MDHKQTIMVSLGAAVGANCIPCFDYIYSRAKELDMPDSEIREIIETAFKVKNGATEFLKHAIEEQVGDISPGVETCCGAADAGCPGCKGLRQ